MISEKNAAFSCDTFVVLPPLTDSNFRIFGKNSDRPANEVQEIIFVSNEHTTDNKDQVQCTHIQIPQVSKTYQCILSKPAWCWGAEMGSNEHGVCIGNEAVFSKFAYESRANALTGLDIVRLALERSKSAKSAVELIGELVETYGQGGRCFHPSANITYGYDNSFLVVDNEEAWTIETCHQVWVAKQIKEGYYSMSNVYSIEDDYDLQSKHLETFARENQFWNGTNEKLNFAEVFAGPSPTTNERLLAGRKLLEDLTKNGNFSVFDMISILRDEEAGINVDNKIRGVRTTSSQASILTSSNTACHLFTGTPNPRRSLFKPFIFCKNVNLGPLTVSPPEEVSCQRVHPLYSAHEKANWQTVDTKRLFDFEHEEIMEIINQLKSNEKSHDSYEQLFYNAVSTEIELIRDHPSTQ